MKIKQSDVIYIDMDGVLVQSSETKKEWQENRFKKGFFLNKQPLEGALESFTILSKICNVYILSTPVWSNQYCWMEKRIWIERYLGKHAKKKLILSHNKGLNIGKLLIDDSLEHGVKDFSGTHIHFGTSQFPDWKSVLKYLEL